MHIKGKHNESNHHSPTPELSTDAVAAEIIARKSAPSGRRKIFQFQSRPLICSEPSQHSLVTCTSFVTANEVIPASSDEETNEEILTYQKDPQELLTYPDKKTDPALTRSVTPREIRIDNMATNNSSNTTQAPSPVSAPAPTDVISKLTESAIAKKEEEAPHFDVTQTAYSAYKSLWCWGKKVPVIKPLLDISEDVTNKILATVNVDLPSLDEKLPSHLQRVDDEVVTPAILAVWGFIGPALNKTDETIVKPVMTDVVPRILSFNPLGIFCEEKKEGVEAAAAELS